MSNIYLEPIEHVYIDSDTKERYKSVTTVLSLLEEEFPADDIALAIANQDISKKKEKYHNMSQEVILESWERENKVANDYGTMVHNLLEDYIKKNRFYFPTDQNHKNILNAFDELDIDFGEKVHCERIMYSKKHKIAGTSDLIIDVNHNTFDVLDHKTNKTFNFYSLYEKKLLPPLTHLDDCQYNIYALQLSIYAYMYENETRKNCRRLMINYFDKENCKFTIYPVPYMKMEAESVLNFYHDNYIL